MLIRPAVSNLLSSKLRIAFPFSRQWLLVSVVLLAVALVAPSWGQSVAPTTAVGSTSATQTVTVTIGTAGTVNALQVLTQGQPNLDFQFLGGSCAVGTAYALGASCTVSYSFSPTSGGMRLGAVVLTTSTPTVMATVYLSGIGTGGVTGLSVGTMTTYAGTGTRGTTGNGGPATSAKLGNPESAELDGAGNLYIPEHDTDTFREVMAATGIVTAYAGNGTQGFSGDGGAATSAQLQVPEGVVFDGAGNLYIADEGNCRIRKVTAATGIITTVAGTGSATESGDGGAATSAGLSGASNVALDTAGNIYISEFQGERVRKVTVATGIISTVAGNGTAGYRAAGDGGAATSAELNNQMGIAFDIAGNLYIADFGNNRVRKVTVATGIITTVAGTGTAGFSGDGGAATNAKLDNPSAVSFDGAGNLYIADAQNSRVRKVTGGTITTVAGNGTSTLASGVAATSAGLGTGGIDGLPIDGSGNFYISDYPLSVVHKVTVNGGLLTFPNTVVNAVSATQTAVFTNNTGLPITFSGFATGASNYILAGSTCTATSTIANGASCNITVAFNPHIVGTLNDVVTISVGGSPLYTVQLTGTGTGLSKTLTFAQPTSPIAIGTGSIAATVSNGDPVTFTVTGPATLPGGVTTYNTTSGSATTITYTSGGTVTITASSAATSTYGAAPQITQTVYVYEPIGPTTPPQSGNVIFTTAGTLAAISVVTTGITGLDFQQAAGGTCTVGTFYNVGEQCQVNYTFGPLAPGQRNGAIVATSASPTTVLATTYLTGFGLGPVAVAVPGTISTYAGNGSNTYSGNGVAATSAGGVSPSELVLDAAGNLFMGCSSCQYVREVVAATGIIKTLVGTGTQGSTGDGGPATNAETDRVDGIALDGAGNLYLSDRGSFTVRKVTAATGIITTIAGNGSNGPYSGEGGPATAAVISVTEGLAVDVAGNLYIAGSFDNRIFKVTAATGIITTVAGTGAAGNAGDGGAATSAQVSSPLSLALDSVGNLYIADGTYRIRKVTAATGIISTVAGTGTAGYTGDGGVATSAEISGGRLTLDAAGNLYFVDSANEVVRKVNAATGIINTIIGNGVVSGGVGTFSGDGGPAISAGIYPYAGPSGGVAVDGAGNIYLGDYGNFRIRKVTNATTLTFPSTAVGASSASQTVSFANAGTSPLTLSGFSVGTVNYVLTGSTCNSASTIAAGDSCSITVTFKPQSVGTKTDTVTLSSGGVTLYTVALTGVATIGTKIITFPQPVTPVAQGSNATLLATVSDVDPVTYAITAGTASLSGNVVTYTTLGSVTITASSAATANASAATPVARTVQVELAQTLSFTPPGSTVLGGSVATLGATSSSGLPVTYTVTSGTATITGTGPTATVTYTTLGTVTVTLSQAGNGTYAAANTISYTVTVLPPQVYTVNSVGVVDMLTTTPSFFLNVGTAGATATTGAVAFDSNAAAWAVTPSTNTLFNISTSGLVTNFFPNGGLSGPAAVATDGAGTMWIANLAGTISTFSNTGIPLTTNSGLATVAPGATGGQTDAIAIDSSGGVWVANSTGATVTHIIGGATPVVTPLATGIKNGTLGTTP